MRVAIHQPDLLPYSGFWFKMASCDTFVIARHDQFQKHGYQRRVRMRDTWVSHRLVGKPALVPIDDVRVQPGWAARLVDAIRGRYTGARYYAARGPELLDRIDALHGETLVEVNLALIEVFRELLGITTPLLFTDPPGARGAARLIEQVRAVGGDSYLSGPGGAAYLGEEGTDLFARSGVELVWSRHHAVTGDSVVSVLMDYDDPAEVIRRTG